MKSIFRNISNGSFAVTNHLLLFSTNFFAYLLLVRSLDLKSLGVWAIFITWASIVDQFRQGFIHHDLIKLIHKYPNQKTSLISTAFYLNLTLIVISTIPFWVLTSTGHINPVYSFLILSTTASGLIQFLNTLVIAEENLQKQFRINLFYSILSSVLVLSLYSFGRLTIDFLLLTQIISSFAIFIFFFKKIGVKLQKPKIAICLKLINFGKFASTTNILSLLFNKADILILSLFVGKEALALYHFASKVINYVEIPLNGLSQFLFPKLSKYFVKFGTLAFQPIYFKSMALMILSLVPGISILYIWPETLFEIFNTPGLNRALSLIYILTIASLFKPIGRVSGLSIDAMDKPQLNLALLTFSLLSNIGLNFILIPFYSLEGAAWATFTSIILTISIGQLVIYKTIDSAKTKFSYQIKLNKAI